MARKSSRDEFSARTRRDLAARAGHACSFPGCGRPTSGPSAEAADASVDLGEACHISAAASGPGARRYDSSMTGEERRSIDNGIWMCRTHAKLIDSDEATYTTEQLHKWKREAEARAEERLRSGAAPSAAGESFPGAGGPLPPNPFACVLAVREEAAFIGRERELGRLRSMLAGGSVALLGEPKIGKSSLLFRLAATWPGEVLGPVDFEAMADGDDFYAALGGELGMGTGGWRRVRAELEGRSALLLLDELDKAPARGWAARDLGLLRSVCGRNPGLKVIAASRRPPKQVFPDAGDGSPAFNFLQPFPLGDLAEAEAKTLLTHPWAAGSADFTAAAVAELLAAAGRHPFHLQRAAFHRYEALGDAGHDWRAAWRQDLELLL